MDWRFSKTEKTALLVLGVLIAAAVTAGLLVPQEQEAPPERMSHIRSILELQDVQERRRKLVVGYNYELMQRYARGNGQTIEIGISYGDSYLDSLRAGVVDLVAVPYSDSLQLDGLVSSHHIDSLSVWVMREEDRHEMKHVQNWLKAWKHSEEYQETKEIFLRRFSPFRSRPRRTISPYDEIIKAYADSAGMDWRMLAAVIYQESRFHIEARSHRGASGLMQMMPVAATKYGVSDPFDPEQNISAGAMMLKRLRDRYREVAADDVESFRFALAAYNAGVGRMKSLLDFARHQEATYDRWDSLKLLIPEMNEAVQRDSTADFMTIKGTETLRYVDNVFAIYEEFKRICPEK